MSTPAKAEAEAEPDPASLISITTPPTRNRRGELVEIGDGEAALERDVARRITRLMLIRTVVISLVLGLTFWVAWLNDATLTAPAPLLLLAVIAVTYALTIVYAVLLRRGADPERLVWPQLGGDLAVTTVVVYVTGAAQSAYGFFFGLSVIGAAAVRFRRGAAIVAAWSILLMVAVGLLGWADALPIPMIEGTQPWRQSLPELGRSLGLNLAAIVGIGVLALGLGGQIQLTAASLASQRQAVLDLYTLHQDIVRSLSSGLLTVDLAGRVLTLNQTAADILRVDADAVIDLDLDDVVPGLGERLAGLGPRDALRRADLEIVQFDGLLVLGISVSPLRDQRDRVVGRVVNFQDLTELRGMERNVKHAERMASIGRLAAGVAHEIRNPLAAISGSVELLRLAPDVSSDDEALMAIVTRECDRLNGLITELLDYANPRPPQNVDFDIGMLIDETLQVFRQDRSFAGVAIKTRGVPAPAPVPVCADPAKLRQVVWNMVRNAAEAAATGGGHVEVVLEVEAEDVVMTVGDDGPGIPAVALPHIFDPFFTTKKQGTGLGLATCHSIVTEHGGTIDVASEVGSGTRFVVRLPRDATSQRPAVSAFS